MYATTQDTCALSSASPLWQAAAMSNRFAFVFFALICGLLAFDWLNNEAQVIIFLGQRLLDLIAWIAFWR